jgi:hypothetical protein
MQPDAWRCFFDQADLRSGDTMFRESPRRTLEAIVTKAIARVAPSAGLKRSVTKQAQSKSIELPGSHNIARAGIFSRTRWQC